MTTEGLNRELVSSGVPKRYGQTAYKRQLAYAHLGINPNDVQPVAFFRENLRRMARQINRRPPQGSDDPSVRLSAVIHRPRRTEGR
jgi:hypothetical protein